ncbi:hypothetical protein ElyMa_006703300 [Elysia marginata]|uniref:Uncharacterized protein n=1 Tax=Elysia marginata TaxID=1093978 RepID=A0AAV4IQ42_9GAST|nr:hypothetical protein ElyMa_006703300 [Elysia marginata]
MLRQHNLPAGTFLTYVGNRMHVLFHLAGVLLLHWDKVKKFLDMQCTAGGLPSSWLKKDMANEKIMAQVWALGVVGKIFTGPWMTKLYSSDMSNLEMRPLVQKSELLLQSGVSEPEQLLAPTVNAFSESLSPGEDSVLSALHNFISGRNFNWKP